MGAQRRRGRTLVFDIALVGDGAWLVATVYEGLVDVPQLFIDARPRRRPGLLRPGSPLRYFAFNGPLALLPTALSLWDGWRRGHRQGVYTAIAGFGSALALSGYLIRTINLPLLLESEELEPATASRIKRRWHTVNALRLVALGTGVLAIQRIRPRETV